jgi:hypothetical protein
MRFIAPKIDIISVLYNKNERILFTFIIRNSKLRKTNYVSLYLYQAWHVPDDGETCAGNKRSA